MVMIFLIIIGVAVLTGGILYGVNYWLAKKNSEVLANRYIGSIGALFGVYLVYSLPFLLFIMQKWTRQMLKSPR